MLKNAILDARALFTLGLVNLGCSFYTWTPQSWMQKFVKILLKFMKIWRNFRTRRHAPVSSQLSAKSGLQRVCPERLPARHFVPPPVPAFRRIPPACLEVFPDSFALSQSARSNAAYTRELSSAPR